MRDTIRYPVTYEEKIELLNRLKDQLVREQEMNQISGDTSVLIIEEIIGDYVPLSLGNHL